MQWIEYSLIELTRNQYNQLVILSKVQQLKGYVENIQYCDFHVLFCIITLNIEMNRYLAKFNDWIGI